MELSEEVSRAAAALRHVRRQEQAQSTTATDNHRDKQWLERTNVIQEHRDTIATLQADIVRLEAQLAQQTAARSTMASEEDENMLDNEVPVDGMASQIRSLEHVTGISFSQVQTNVVRTDDEIHRVYDLTGMIYELSFAVKFEVNESTMRILWLQSKVDSGLRGQLKPFLQRVEKTCNLHGFFKGLAKLAKATRERARIFDRFTKEHPKVLAVKGGSIFADTLSTVNSGQISFDIRWTIELSELADLHEDCQLQARAARQALSLDQDGVLSSLPKYFHMMCNLWGAEKAIQFVMELFAQDIKGVKHR